MPRLMSTDTYLIDYHPDLSKVVVINALSNDTLASILFKFDQVDHKAILSNLQFQPDLSASHKKELAAVLIHSIRQFTGEHCRLLTIADRNYQEAFTSNGFLTESDPRIMLSHQPKPAIEEILDSTIEFIIDKDTLLTHSAEISELLKANAYWAKEITAEEVQARIASASIAIALKIADKAGKPKIIGFVRSISNGRIDYTSDMVIDQLYQNLQYGSKLFTHLYNIHSKRHELSLLIRAGKGVGLETTPKLYKKFGFVNSDALVSLPAEVVLMHTPRVEAPAPHATPIPATASTTLAVAAHGLFSASRGSVEADLTHLFSLSAFRLMKNNAIPGQVIVMLSNNQIATAHFVFDQPDKKAILSNLRIMPGFDYLRDHIITFLLEAVQGHIGKYTRLLSLLETNGKELILARGLSDTPDPRIMLALSPTKEIPLPAAPFPVFITEDKEELKRHSSELTQLLRENAYWAKNCSEEEFIARIDNATHAIGLRAIIEGKETFIGLIRMISNGHIGYASDLVILEKYQKSGLGTLLGGYLFNKYMCNRLEAAVVIRAGAGTGAVATPKLYAKAAFIDSDKVTLPEGISFFTTPPVFYPPLLNTIPATPKEASSASTGPEAAAALSLRH